MLSDCDTFGVGRHILTNLTDLYNAGKRIYYIIPLFLTSM
jgi:hypothetical protein